MLCAVDLNSIPGKLVDYPALKKKHYYIIIITSCMDFLNEMFFLFQNDRPVSIKSMIYVSNSKMHSSFNIEKRNFLELTVTADP